MNKSMTRKPSPLALDIVTESFVRDYCEARRVHDCPLDALYAHLRGVDASLTIGVFHDLLRTLHASNRVRLGGWSGPLDRIPQPELALFISSKVMYDAFIPQA